MALYDKKAHKRPLKPKSIQKSVRIPAELVDAIEERAYRETIALNINVDFTTMVRRGLELMLQTPTPDIPSLNPCNLVPIGAGQVMSRCLSCGAQGPGTTVFCVGKGETIERKDNPRRG